MSRPDLYPLLTRIEAPSDLRKLPDNKLVPLAGELREFLIQTVSQMGGHFAAGLGTVELTVALHYVFDTPHDRLVWDVGHQAYPHKVLTGRRQRLQTIKHKGGLAPFPSRFESEYDTFGVGHSSTSISAAIGIFGVFSLVYGTSGVLNSPDADSPIPGALSLYASLFNIFVSALNLLLRLFGGSRR